MLVAEASHEQPFARITTRPQHRPAGLVACALAVLAFCSTAQLLFDRGPITAVHGRLASTDALAALIASAFQPRSLAVAALLAAAGCALPAVLLFLRPRFGRGSFWASSLAASLPLWSCLRALSVRWSAPLFFAALAMMLLLVLADARARATESARLSLRPGAERT